MAIIIPGSYDDRPKRHGWAPGHYCFSCKVCGKEVVGDKRAIECASCAYAEWTPTHRHGKTGGCYRLLDMRVQIEATNEAGVVYEAQDGTFWVRSYTEFHDGRFARMVD